MRWPWCGIAWQDAYHAERAEVSRLTDVIVRLERVREGLPELPAERRKPVEPIPDTTLSLIEQMWSADHARKAEEKRARQLYGKLGDWEKVDAVLLETMNGGSDE